MKKGDHVVATRSLGIRGVQEGAHGVVRDVSFLGTMKVDFGNGKVLTARGGDVKRASVSGPLGVGCGPGLVAFTLVGIVPVVARRMVSRRAR